MNTMHTTHAADVEAEKLRLELRLSMLDAQDNARSNFFDFVRYVWPDAVLGAHHKRIAEAFDRIANGTLKRLILNLPPRHTKSEFASYLLPAYLMGRDPRLQIIEATHTAELAVRFGRKVRDLMDSSTYSEIFPDVKLKVDSKAAGRWDTNRGGTYFATGVGGAVTGRGADLCVDPNGFVQTPRGTKRAGDVQVGDYLLGIGGYGRVRHVITSEHQSTVVINDDLRVSEFHPVWVVDRGWVDARDVKVGESLYNPHKNIYNSSITQIRGISDVELQSRVQHLGKDAPALRQPERRKLQQLWGTWHSCLRKMGEVCQLLGRLGICALYPAYFEPQEQRGHVLSRELRMGVTRGSTKQPPRQCVYRSLWPTKNNSSMGPCNGSDSGHDQASDICDEDASGRGVASGKNVPQPVSRRATKLGRAGGWLLRLLGGCSKKRMLQQASSASCPSWESENLCWIPVEVRNTRTEHHGPRAFVNFHVEGSNTFVYNSYLTHNCIIDDPHSEQDAMSALALENAWDWYQGGPRTRLQPGGAIVVVMTRWGTQDLSARLIKAQSSHNADKWEVIEFPAILPSGKPLWPEYWKLEELESVRASLSVQKWNAMYQQQPTNDEGAILKREWWRIWPNDTPPQAEYVIQSYDTAYSKKETADYSVITTWGVFQPTMDDGPNIILMGVKKGRWDFPELKRVAMEEYKYWQPDNVLIEAKATGTTLQQELRRVGIPVTMYSPGGRRTGQDKVSRANSIAPIFESGMVWAPDTQWAEELIEECAAFPNGDHDDQVDSTIQAMMRFRSGNFISLDSDEVWGDSEEKGVVHEYY